MNKILERIPINNLITPGEVYIFNKSKDPWMDHGPIIYMYFVKSDEEVIPAIDMELSYNDYYTLRKFIGWRRMSPSCIEFIFCSYNRDEEKDIQHSLFLHRIKTVQEALHEASLYHQQEENEKSLHN